MKDMLKNAHLDREQVALDEAYQIRSWTEILGCTEQELRAAVAAVGRSPDTVRAYVQTEKKMAARIRS